MNNSDNRKKSLKKKIIYIFKNRYLDSKIKYATQIGEREYLEHKLKQSDQQLSNLVNTELIKFPRLMNEYIHSNPM